MKKMRRASYIDTKIDYDPQKVKQNDGRKKLKTLEKQ
jgi:hypothetical protein